MHRFSPVTATIVAIAASLVLVSPASAAAVDYFLQVEGVPGESTDAQFKDNIDVRSFSWGASRSADKKSVNLETFRVTKKVDLASPRLFERLAQGTTIPSVELIARKAGEAQLVFLKYCFQNVQVASIQDAGSGDTVDEEVGFSYGAVSESYTQQKPDGTAGNTVFAGWNATTGKLITSYPDPCG